MKTILTSTFVLTFICITSLFIIAEANDDGFVLIFNGTDLTDWEGIPGGWKVEGGCIVGESTPEKPCKRSHYLYWTKREADNFHLRLTFRLQGNGNSGIQFRSEKRPDWDTYGYQADVDASLQWTGCLFHHKRAAVVKRGFDNIVDPDGKIHSKQFADPQELIKFYKPGDWNDYEIIADGSVITLLINGKMMCRVDDRHATESAKSGIIALQMHQGPPMKVEFKNIRFKELNKK